MRLFISGVEDIKFTRSVAVDITSIDSEAGCYLGIRELDIYAYGKDTFEAFTDLLYELRYTIESILYCDPSELHPSALPLKDKLKELIET